MSQDVESTQAAPIAAPPILELRPGASPRVRGARRWSRRLAWIGAILLVLLVVGRVALHYGVAIYYSALGGRVTWQEFDAGLGSGTSVDFGRPQTQLEAFHLKALPNLYRLRSVNLTFCERINEDGLTYLEDLTGLYDLQLSRRIPVWSNGKARDLAIGPRISDAGLARLKKLTELRMLFLEGADITDAGLAPLLGMRKLDTLDLSYTRISDASIETLIQLKSLRVLDINGTAITCEGKKRLDAGLPDARVLLERCDSDLRKAHDDSLE